MRDQFTGEQKDTDMNQFEQNTHFHLDVDPLAETQPTRGITRVMQPQRGPAQRRARRGFSLFKAGFSTLLITAFGILLLLSLYFFYPDRTNVLVLGIDDRLEGQAVGRSDTMILVSFQPLSGKVGMLSIPRDLWVNVPGYGEGRINTAHFYAEAEQPGSGLLAARQVIEANFPVKVDNTVRLRFDNFVNLIDLLGGLEINLNEPMSGYPAGNHVLMADEALAFVRDREGSDDFFRMQRGQIFIKAVLQKLVSTQTLRNLPQILVGINQMVESDVPIYLWPRLGLTLLRSGTDGIDSQTITREMVTPFTTTGGAQVLAPNWERITPLFVDMFGN